MSITLNSKEEFIQMMKNLVLDKSDKLDCEDFYVRIDVLVNLIKEGLIKEDEPAYRK